VHETPPGAATQASGQPSIMPLMMPVKRPIKPTLATLLQAAEEGHSRAQFLIAERYASGMNVDRDPAWALRWYAKAARQGHVEAAFAYGIARANGIGLPRDLEEAYRFLRRAAQGGHGLAARARDTLERHMSPAARLQALAEASPPGMHGQYADPPTIMYAQHVLNELGYAAGRVDGALGARTRTAICAFQVDRHTRPNGELDSVLVEALRQLSAAHRAGPLRRPAAEDAG